MAKSKSASARKNRVSDKKPKGLVDRIRALSSKQRMLILVLLFAVLGSILVMTSEAASLTSAQKAELQRMEDRHEAAEDAKKAQCKTIDDRTRKKLCKSEADALKDRNDAEYDRTKDAFKQQNKQNSGVCGASTFAATNGSPGQPGTGSSNGSAGSSGNGGNGTNGAGGASSSGNGASGSNGASGGSSNSCR